VPALSDEELVEQTVALLIEGGLAPDAVREWAERQYGPLLMPENSRP
jgi:hypothetical protein